MARLQSQVGLLEERVAQLERAGFSGGSSAAYVEPSPDAGLQMTEPAPLPKRSGSKPVASSAAPAGLKPSTREIQQALKNAGFYQGTLDGKMGPVTRDAVKEFQRVHGLTDDGIVGKQTWAKLQAYSNLAANSGEATAAESLK
jgi:peptidoglycan hydrolase-like protein with peptidoglycan-binding domain